MPIARYYDESRNEDGRTFDGVPLRDLTEDEFAALPPWLQASIDAAPLYRKTKPRTEKAEAEAPAEPAAAPEPEPAAEPDRKRR